MIQGIGNDVIELARIEAAMSRHGNAFVRRVLSLEEFEMTVCQSERRRIEFVAGRFAAKEAIAKATGQGIARLNMNAVTIAVAPSGLVVTWTDASALSTLAPENYLHVSISHSKAYAVAMAILERA